MAQTLDRSQLEFDAIDLADMVWLARFMPPGSSTREPPIAAERPEREAIDRDETALPPPELREPSLPISPPPPKGKTSSDSPEMPPGTPFAVPAAPALRTRLDLARALRPLMRKVPSSIFLDLDETATVTRIAETEVWIPVQQARPERWLELDLVIEDSKTTAIWERTIAELKHLVEYQGAFRSVRTWRLTTRSRRDGDDRPVLFPGWHEGDRSGVTQPRPHSPRELIDPRGRRLVWVVSDCVSSLWRSEAIGTPGGIYDLLDGWGRSQPVAIVQMFPPWLWSRTALQRGYTVRFGSPIAGIANARLEVQGLPRRLLRRSRADRVNVPIFTLDAASLNAWSRTIAGYGAATVSGRTFDRAPARSRRSGDVLPSAPETLPETLTPRERVDRFRSSVTTPTVVKLATLMAATPVSLPVIDLLREEFAGDFPEPVESYHVAEVLLSGLLRRCDGDDERMCRYEFWGDDADDPGDRVRDILLGGASISETERVLNVLSASIYRKLGYSTAKSFEALLGEVQAEDGELRGMALPFARVGLRVLRRLGGEYGEIADRFDPGRSGTVTVRRDRDVTLEEFEYEVAVFERDNTPELEAFEYESVETIAVLKQFEFETVRIARPQTDLSGRSRQAYRQLLTTYFATQFVNESECREFLESVIPGWEYGSDYDLNLRDKEKIIASYVDTFGRNTSALGRVVDALCDRDPEAARYLCDGELFHYPGSWGYTEKLSEEIGLDMMSIPGGTFLMGSPDDEPERMDRESPQHEVTVSPFFMGRYAITQAQWRIVASYPQIDRELDPDPANFKSDNRPVEQVDWDDATEFCQRLSAKTGKTYRLPSEAEWEYACRAGTTTPFHFGDLPSVALMNYDGNYTYNDSPTGEYREQTVEVGSFPSNSFGLYDMHGNVWEWCEDDWHESYEGAPTDGSAWLEENRTETLRLLRGGSWGDFPGDCRSAYRGNDSRDIRDLGIGFRVVYVSPRAL